MTVASRAVFLDRDGVLNEIVYRDGKPGSPRSLEEFRLVRGIEVALNRMRAAGFRLFVVTNQPDVARGLLNPSDLASMNERLRLVLPIEDVVTCPHDDQDVCLCRKPKPGMLRHVAATRGIRLSESFMIGDSWKDVQAGQAAGCTNILIRRFYNQGTEAKYVVDDLHQAAEVILKERKHVGSSRIAAKAASAMTPDFLGENQGMKEEPRPHR